MPEKGSQALDNRGTYGLSTEYGKSGADVASAPVTPSPLQKQTGSLVKLCAGIAAALFALVGVVTYINLSGHSFADRLTDSILSGVTLAMAMIPEEFPVILTVFLSMVYGGLPKNNRWYANCPRWKPLTPFPCCASIKSAPSS